MDAEEGKDKENDQQSSVNRINDLKKDQFDIAEDKEIHQQNYQNASNQNDKEVMK